MCRKNAQKFFVGKPKDRVSLERIEIDLEETGFQGPDLFHLARDKNKWQTLVNMLTNLRILEYDTQECLYLWNY